MRNGGGRAGVTGRVGGAEANGELGKGYALPESCGGCEENDCLTGEDVVGGKVYDEDGPGVGRSDGEKGDDVRVLKTIGDGADREGAREGRKEDSHDVGACLCSTRNICEHAYMRAYSQLG